MKMMLILIFSGWLMLPAGMVQSQNVVPSLLPWPQRVEWKQARFDLRNAVVEAGKGVETAELKAWLEESGTKLNGKSKRKILVSLLPEIPEAGIHQTEAYRLEVTPDQIRIGAVTGQGVYWAVQTLRQLTAGRSVAGCVVVDWPAFRIRGFMHDVGRGYISLDELKQEIRTFSRYKVNVFHWHLTEDLGWRLESRRFPGLNDSANFGRYPGKYYTLDQARELVGFCKNHNVLLIPEIDMPGHSAAFRKTFGCDMQSPEGMVILKQLLEEICEVFCDVPYLHIGTDEVGFTNPRFVPEMVAFLRDRGKKVISWNPGWNYKPGEIDMLQMWSSRGKPHPGIPVIDSRLHYLNHYDAFADVVALYKSNVAGQQEGSPDYAGMIVAVWNDRRVDGERSVLIQNAFCPSVLAMAERTWRGGGRAYIYEGGTLLPSADSAEFREFAGFEKRMLWHKAHLLKDCPFAYVRQTDVKWRITDPFPNGGTLDKVFPPETELMPEYSYEGRTYATGEATGAAIYLRHVWGTLIPSFYKNPQPDHTAYAYTWVYSSEEKQVGLWACTQNYGRSEKDLPPPAGKWDYRESRIWLNGQEVAPPVWDNTHRVKDSEIPLRNENFEMRPPIPVTLHKGWNSLLLKLPVGQFSSPEVRLVKWMFTAVFVTPDGKRAADGLIYSPDRLLPAKH